MNEVSETINTVVNNSTNGKRRNSSFHRVDYRLRENNTGFGIARLISIIRSLIPQMLAEAGEQNQNHHAFATQIGLVQLH